MKRLSKTARKQYKRAGALKTARKQVKQAHNKMQARHAAAKMQKRATRARRR